VDSERELGEGESELERGKWTESDGREKMRMRASWKSEGGQRKRAGRERERIRVRASRVEKSGQRERKRSGRGRE
jgi:hypothetical protein